MRSNIHSNAAMKKLAACTAVVGGILSVAGLGGCQSAHVSQPLTKNLGGDQPKSQLEFWHQLARRPLTSNDEAFHGLLLFADGKDPAANYNQRVDALKARKMIAGDFHGTADDAIDHGTLSVALVQILHLSGGVTMSVLGPTPRYATRTLQFNGLYPGGSPNQTVSGSEFVGIIGKAEDFQHADTVVAPASLLPSEVGKVDVNGVAINGATLPIAGVHTLQESDVRSLPVELASIDNPFASFDLDGASFGGGDGTPLMLAFADAVPASGPSSAALANGTLKVIVTGVEGTLAEARKSEKDDWVPAKVGMVLTQDAEFRTGPHSAIRFIIPPKQTFTLDRQGTCKVIEAVKSDKNIKTDVGMAYGRVRYDLETIKPNAAGPLDVSKLKIQEAGIEHDSAIRSPNSTLAVRGTEVSMFDQAPFTPQALSLTGRALFQNNRGQFIYFGNKGQGTTKIRSDQSGAVESALGDAVVDPSIALARTPSEQALVSTLISRGSVVSVDKGTGFRVITGGVPPTDAQLKPVLPGKVDFVLRWTGNANLDLSVINQGTGGRSKGEILIPAVGLNATESGGHTDFDHRGGPHGGIEVAFWDGKAPDGDYSLNINYISGVTTKATVEAFKDGKLIQLYDPSANQGSGGLVRVYTTTVGPKPRNQGAVIAPINVPTPPIITPPGGQRPPVSPPPPPPGTSGPPAISPGAGGNAKLVAVQRK